MARKATKQAAGRSGRQAKRPASDDPQPRWTDTTPAEAPRAAVVIPWKSEPVRWHNGRHEVALGVLPLSWIRPAPYNPRKMTKDARERLDRGLHAFGLIDTLVLAEDGELLGGHQRYDSMATNHETEAAVFVVFGLDAHQRGAANLLLNNRKAAGDYDMSKLVELLSELDAHGFDATVTGFNEDELTALLTQDPPSIDEPDRAGASAPEGEEEEREGERREHDPDADPLERSTAGHLKWARERVAMTAAEIETLTEHYEAYKLRVGTAYGFVADLLGAVERRWSEA